jgi:biotin transport system substrate-specific component
MPGGVPMTLQTFAIPLAGIILGKRNGVLAAVIYVMLGAAGVPVFHNMNGGFGIILGPTGGFILSFPLMALTAAIGAGKNNSLWLASWLVIGAVTNYICGMLWFTAVTSAGLAAAFLVCVAPFLIMDTAKIIVAASLGKILGKVLKNAPKEMKS